MVDRDPAIACSLDGAAMTDRLAWIRGLGERALIEHRREGPVLHLAFDPAHAGDVRRFVRQEQACCGFLDFAVEEAPEAIRVTVTVPPAALDIADEVLGYFAPGA